jgi:hypothetical protein
MKVEAMAMKKGNGAVRTIRMSELMEPCSVVETVCENACCSSYLVTGVLPEDRAAEALP